MEKKILAWHFVGETLRDGREIPADGETLTHVGEVIPCKQGLHASERLLGALRYAPGHTVCRVELWGDVKHDAYDKMAARHRRILWRIDAEQILRTFARRCALDDIHLWDAPRAVREYLETGNKSIIDAAKHATEAAVKDCASPATWAAWIATWISEKDATYAASAVGKWARKEDVLLEMVEAERKRIGGEKV